MALLRKYSNFYLLKASTKHLACFYDTAGTRRWLSTCFSRQWKTMWGRGHRGRVTGDNRQTELWTGTSHRRETRACTKGHPECHTDLWQPLDVSKRYGWHSVSMWQASSAILPLQPHQEAKRTEPAGQHFVNLQNSPFLPPVAWQTLPKPFH